MNKFLSFTTALCVALSVTAEAKIWRVNNNVGVLADFATIPGAINAATAGDTIHVEASAIDYNATVRLNKRLYIRGTGYFLNETTPNPKAQFLRNPATLTYFYFDPGSKGSVLEGLVVSYVYLSDSLVTVQRNQINIVYPAAERNAFGDTIRNNYITGNVTVNGSGYKGQGLMFYNNILGGGVYVTSGVVNDFSGYFINNSFISANNLGFTCSNFLFQNNIFNQPNFDIYINSNTFINNIAANSGIPTGNNNLRNIPMANVYEGWSSGTGFSTDGRYKLKAGSPAIGVGTLNGSAVDCGAFGGPAPYVLSGMPSMPSIYEVNMPTQVNSGTPAINITVSAAAH